MKAGADVDRAKDNGVTPLLMAAQKGHDAVVAQLVKAGAVANRANKDGATPLFMAAQKGHEVVVAQLVEAGADADTALRSDGVTALMASAHFCHAGCVRLLLGSGASTSTAAGAANGVLGSRAGDRAIDIARRAGHQGVVEMLA